MEVIWISPKIDNFFLVPFHTFLENFILNPSLTFQVIFETNRLINGDKNISAVIVAHGTEQFVTQHLQIITFS